MTEIFFSINASHTQKLNRSSGKISKLRKIRRSKLLKKLRATKHSRPKVNNDFEIALVDKLVESSYDSELNFTDVSQFFANSVAICSFCHELAYMDNSQVVCKGRCLNASLSAEISLSWRIKRLMNTIEADVKKHAFCHGSKAITKVKDRLHLNCNNCIINNE